jgi:hypothetical protein
MTGLSSASFQRKLESRGQWAEHFVSEQRSEAIFARKRDCFVTSGFSQ